MDTDKLLKAFGVIEYVARLRSTLFPIFPLAQEFVREAFSEDKHNVLFK